MEKNYAKKLVLSEKFVNLIALQKEKPPVDAEGFC
jgi:hypothetical protein